MAGSTCSAPSRPSASCASQALLRLARLSRLARIDRLLGGQHKKELVEDVVHNRSQYALFLTLLLALIVMSVSSVLILQFETQSPEANIKTGGDALWWAMVTITTVGYGDFFPVTTLGRATAAFVMFSGIGIIGALASILASLLVSSPPAPDAGSEAVPDAPAAPSGTAASVTVAASSDELAQTREELRGPGPRWVRPRRRSLTSGGCWSGSLRVQGQAPGTARRRSDPEFVEVGVGART